MRFAGKTMGADAHGDHRMKLVGNDEWVEFDHTIYWIKQRLRYRYYHADCPSIAD